MAGEDVLLRIGADLSAYEAALAKAAQLATSIPSITLLGPETAKAAEGLTSSLKGVEAVSNGVVRGLGSIDEANKKITGSAATASRSIAEGSKSIADTGRASGDAAKTVRGLGDALDETGKKSRGLFDLGMIGRVVQVGLAFKALGVVLDSLKSLVDVDRQLSLIAGTVDNLNERQQVLAESSRMVFDVMKQTGRSADEAGQLVLELQRAFGDSAESLQAAYIPALALTIQKETDTAATIKILIGLYNNFGSTLQGVATQQEKYLAISDMVVTAANKSAIGINDFVTALGFVSKPATNALVPLNDLLAMMSLMGERSVRASTIGTGLRQVFHDVVFEADRVAAAFDVAVDRANPQPYVLLQTIMKKLGEEFATTGKTSADAMDRIKKAFPGTQELAGFNVLFEIFPQLADRADLVAKGMGASQRILDEFSKSVSAAASALSAEFLQALDAVLGGDVPGKFEGIANAVNLLAEAFKLLRLTILGAHEAWKAYQSLPPIVSFAPGAGPAMSQAAAEVERFKKDSDEITKRLIERQRLVDEARAKAKQEGASVYGPPSPFLGPTAPPAVEVPLKPTVDTTAVKTGLDKLKADAENIIREKKIGNIEIPVSLRIGEAQKDRAAAQKIVDEITAKVAKGIPYDADAQKAFKEAQANVETMTNKISALNKEGATLVKKSLQLELKAPEGQTVQDVIDEALKEFKDTDLVISYRIQLAEGALEAAKEELARVRAIAERVGLGEETRPALRAATAKVGQLTADVNKLQAQQIKETAAAIEDEIKGQHELAKAIMEVEAAWSESEKALTFTTDFARQFEKIEADTAKAIGKAGKAFIDDAYDPERYAAAVKKIYATGDNLHQEYLNKLIEDERKANNEFENMLREGALSKPEELTSKIRTYAEGLSAFFAKTANDMRDTGAEAEYIAVQVGKFIDKLTETDLEERKLAGLQASFHLSGVEAEIAMRAIVQFGMSIEELANNADPAMRRLAESIRRGAQAARDAQAFALNEAFKGTAAAGAGEAVRATNEALEKQIGDLGNGTTALEKYNNRARDLAVAQAQAAQQTALFADDGLGYLIARLDESVAAMDPLLKSIGDGLINVLQSAERATSDFFFNAFQGNIKSAKEAFADFGKSILRTLSDVLASAVVKDFLGLITGKGLSGEGILGLLGGLLGGIAGFFGGGTTTPTGVPGVGSGPGAVYGPPSFETTFGAGAGPGANTAITALTGSLTTLAPAVLQIAGLLGVPGAGALGGMMGVLPLLKEIPSVFQHISTGFTVVESVLGGLERIGIGGGLGAAGSIIGLIGGMIGDHDVALAGSLVSALGTFSKIAFGIGEAVYGAATGGIAAAGIGGVGALGVVDAGAEIVAGAGLLGGTFEGLAAGGGILSTAFEAMGAVFSAFSAIALPLAVVSLPLIFGFFEDMGREEIIWKSIQKNRAQAGFTGDVFGRGAQLEQQLQTGGPASVRHELETNEAVRRDLSVLAAEAINVVGRWQLAAQAVLDFGDNVMQEAQRVITEGMGGMSFETAQMITSLTHDVLTEPGRLVDELNFFLAQLEKFGIKAANIDLDIGIGKNWQGALGAISGVQEVIEAYNDLFQAIDTTGAPGPGGAPGTPPISDAARQQNQLLLNAALAVNVAFKLLTDQMGVAQQATVEFGEVIGGIPTAILSIGSMSTDITNLSEQSIQGLLDQFTETIKFEQFVVAIKKITDALGMLRHQAELDWEGTLGSQFKPGILPPPIGIAIDDLPEGLAMGVADAVAAGFEGVDDTLAIAISDTMKGIFVKIGDDIIDISTASKEDLDILRRTIIKGLTEAFIREPEKIVGIMDLEKLKKPGETVEQAGQRLGTAFLGIAKAMKDTQLAADLASGATTKIAEAFKAYDKATVALETATGPEELLAAIGSLQQAIPALFQTMIDEVRRLEAEIERIDVAIADAASQFLNFSVVAETLDLSQATDSIQHFYYALSTLEGRLAALPGVIQVLTDTAGHVADAVYRQSQAAAFTVPGGGSPLNVEASIQAGLAQLAPLAGILVNTLAEAASIPDPVARMQAINSFVGQVDGLYQTLTSGIHDAYERARADVHGLAEAERERIAKIRAEGQKTYAAIQKGLQDQKEGAQKQSRDAIETIREESDDQLKALQKAKEARQKETRDYVDGIREVADAQKEALQDQIDALEESIKLSKEWSAAVEKIHDTILDLTLGDTSAITNPQQRLALAQAEFTGARASYAATPTAEGAEKVADLGRRVIDALAEVFPRASKGPSAFDEQSRAVLMVLKTIEDQAKERVGDQEAMVLHLKAMRDQLEEIGDTADRQIKEAEKLTEAFVEALDKQIEDARDTAETQIKSIEDQTEAYIDGIDKQIEANEKAMDEWLAGLVEEEEAISKAEKEWMEYLSIAEQRDIQGVKNALAPLMRDAAIAMKDAAREAELQRTAMEQMRDGITGGTPTDVWIAARTSDMVALQGALPSQIEAALARQVGSYLQILLQSLGFGGYAEGTPSVPHTTLAKVHQGEMIITAGDADMLRRYGIKVIGGGGGHTVEQNNIFNISGARDPEALIDAIADRVAEKLRGSLGSDIIQRTNGRRR